ncbi:MAG: T9SS type A sorting domain-containing protein [Bacteroidales bacterium]|jgi:hypothetical protein|nr:T9SS type A sorting domain-containing protein [Bacteroidales bacterium]
MKRSIILTISLFAMLFASNIKAQSTLESLQGDGSPDDPYRISSVADLRTLSAYVMTAEDYSTNTQGKNFMMTNDIRFTEADLIYDFDGDGVAESNFIPIGGRMDSVTPSDYRLFQGHFNGNGYSIFGLRIKYSGVNYVGLFGSTWGAGITCLGIQDAEISGGGSVGSLCGILNSEGLVIECFARNCTINGTFLYVGGLIGATYSNSTVHDCYVTGSNVTGTDFCGGFLGNNGTDCLVLNAYSTASVATTTNSTYYGGFCGYSTRDSTIRKCYFIDTWKATDGAEPGLYSMKGTVMTADTMKGDDFVYLLRNGWEGGTSWSEDIHNVNYGFPVFFYEVALSDVISDNTIAVFPNPASQSIFINIDNNDMKGAKVVILDLLGRTVMTKNISGTSTQCDISTLSPSSYIVTLVQNGRTTARKQIIKK